MNIKKTFQSIFRIQGIIFLISALLFGIGGCTQTGKSDNPVSVEETSGSSEDSETLYEMTDSTLRKETSIIKTQFVHIFTI